jgi:hypothetical protein
VTTAETQYRFFDTENAESFRSAAIQFIVATEKKKDFDERLAPGILPEGDAGESD